MAFKQKRSSSFYLMLGASFLLLVFGIVMIFSASSAAAFSKYGDSFYYFKHQILSAVMGFILLLVLANQDYHKLSRWSGFLIFSALILLMIVIIPGVGRMVGGARRWIELGFFTLQPSELGKLAMVIFTADLLTRRKEQIKELPKLLVPLFPVLILACILVMMQPDLGTAFTIFVVVFVLIFLAGARWSHFFGIAAGGIAVVTLLIFSEDYRRQRFLSFLNPWESPRGAGFHIIQSLIAFGSGGIRGMGLGMSRQKFFYLPAAHTDFIFAIIGEELGLIGSLFIVFIFAFITFIGIKIALRARDQFGTLLGAGIVTVIASQALVNMGAVTGIIPVTGIPLPLVSYGGSSLVFTLSGIGILLNIACQEKRRIVGIKDEDIDLRRRHRRPHLSRISSGPRTKTASWQR